MRTRDAAMPQSCGAVATGIAGCVLAVARPRPDAPAGAVRSGTSSRVLVTGCALAAVAARHGSGAGHDSSWPRRCRDGPRSGPRRSYGGWCSPRAASSLAGGLVVPAQADRDRPHRRPAARPSPWWSGCRFRTGRPPPRSGSALAAPDPAGTLARRGAGRRCGSSPATPSGRSRRCLSLPARPTAEVDRRWRAIYRANRDAIGADPDLIRPGQRLRAATDRDRPQMTSPTRGAAMSPYHERVVPLRRPSRWPPCRARWRSTWAQSAPRSSFGPPPTPALHLEPRERQTAGAAWAHRFTQAAVEIAGGDRPVSQLVRWTIPSVYEDLARSAQLVRRAALRDVSSARIQQVRPQVESIHTCWIDRRDRRGQRCGCATDGAPVRSPSGSSSAASGGRPWLWSLREQRRAKRGAWLSRSSSPRAGACDGVTGVSRPNESLTRTSGLDTGAARPARPTTEQLAVGAGGEAGRAAGSAVALLELLARATGAQPRCGRRWRTGRRRWRPWCRGGPGGRRRPRTALLGRRSRRGSAAPSAARGPCAWMAGAWRVPSDAGTGDSAGARWSSCVREVGDLLAHRLDDLLALVVVVLLLVDLDLEVEQEADRLLLDAVHHRGEHVEALALVLDQRVALGVARR